MQWQDLYNEATAAPKPRLINRANDLHLKLRDLLPRQEDSLKKFDSASKIMKRTIGFVPLSKLDLPDDLTDEAAVVVTARIDGMLALADALLDFKDS